jgi:hypothetical protein
MAYRADIVPSVVREAGRALAGLLMPEAPRGRNDGRDYNRTYNRYRSRSPPRSHTSTSDSSFG